MTSRANPCIFLGTELRRGTWTLPFIKSYLVWVNLMMSHQEVVIVGGGPNVGHLLGILKEIPFETASQWECAQWRNLIRNSSCEGSQSRRRLTIRKKEKSNRRGVSIPDFRNVKVTPRVYPIWELNFIQKSNKCLPRMLEHNKYHFLWHLRATFR